MQKRQVAWRLPWAAALGLCWMAGCIGPRVVTGVTQRGDQLKFVYFQDRVLSYEKGAVKCKAAADGSLSDCQPIQFVFKE